MPKSRSLNCSNRQANGPTYERLGGSDSEFFQSAGVFRGLKGSLYEGGIRVPMIARWPSHIQPGRTSDLISAFWDVLPTLCDIVGLTPPQNIDGLSFAPTLIGQGHQKQHEYLYWEFRAYGGQQVVRMGNWKGVRQNLVPKGKSKNKQPDLSIELYDLATDPGEKHNAADQHPEIVERIATIMKRARTPNPDFPIPALDGP